MPSYQVSLPASNNTMLKDGAGDGRREGSSVFAQATVDFFKYKIAQICFSFLSLICS